MTVDGPPESGRFWARTSARASSSPSPDPTKARTNRYVLYGIIALGVLAVSLIMLLVAWDSGALGSGFLSEVAGYARFLLPVAFIVCFAGVAAYVYSVSSPRTRTITLGVTSRALAVDERPGLAYSFHGAKLGTWGMFGGTAMGTALHLQSGAHRFILGGRDHRLGPGVQLDVPDVGNKEADVDAWVSASDFDQILEIAGLRTRVDVRPPAPGTPTRCLLYPNPFLYQKKLLDSYRIQSFIASSSQPVLAIDVGAEAIWVTDPYSNTLVGSSWRTQAAATPAIYVPSAWSSYGGRGRDFSIAPQMVVSGPTLPLLTIVCLDGFAGNTISMYLRPQSFRRFAWRGEAQVVRDPADYSVSAADWLTLVGAFGLAPHLEDRVSQS